MDIFYRNKVNAGVLHFVSVPKLIGSATLQFNVPSPQDKTFVKGALITKLNYGQRTNSQFQQSLDNTIYVYSFGDMMGDLTLAGLAFPRSCEGNDNGVNRILSYYEENRVSKNVSTLQVTFASHVIKGYLVGINLSTLDPSSGLHNFTLLLKTIPASFRKTPSTTNNATAQNSLNNRRNTASADTRGLVKIIGQ